MLDLWQCGFYDEDGLLFEVFNPLDPANPMAVSDLATGPNDLTLDHVSILTPNLQRSRQFYAEKLGLKTVLEFLPDGGGFIFLVDPCFDEQTHNFKLEIIGPPSLEPRKWCLLDRHGACFDHLAYVTDDVPGAWEHRLQRGAQQMDAPIQDYTVWIAWVKDADGNDVEIMNRFPNDRLMKAFQSGVPVDIASEMGKQ